MSEQDKRAVYMGTFERHRKEMHIRLDDIVLQLSTLKKGMQYGIILGGVALGMALVGLLS
jgi:hypothetical protein